MTLAPDTPAADRPGGLLTDLARVLRTHLARGPRPEQEPQPTPESALLRAMCHDMRSPLASLEAVLRTLDPSAPDPAAGRGELLDLARAQTAHLSSMLRTADASGGAVRRGPSRRLLGDVLRASAAAAGLPADRLTVAVQDCASDVTVGDARVQRILTNLLENAHRHGDGAPVLLTATCRGGLVRLALTQDVARPERVVQYLRDDTPPVDLTGLGLWSVQRHARDLGGRVSWAVSDAGLTLTVTLPDR
ncbi:signal transduction histidine kinase [Geodermatophilus bullaregiensis]|uniref:sensor histidine kinase n=1 Tax=Geodermatophilus bullaregiensis TaxID=1564160 RepID=UPI0019566A2B|nr:HAMP domain-containing sensor histidine kinase [Geodermatophilus bullaregiensis]MBM7806835.1 signal transduction histidine kinase [Geodermatophilus bullaregiensis]